MLNDFHKQAGKKVVIDANVLILFLVGGIDETIDKINIKKVKATKSFTNNDYKTLINVLDPFESFITTPNILTEISNLIFKEKFYFREKILNYLSVLLTEGYILEEVIESKIVCSDHSLNYLGLTDVSIIKISEERLGVITKDLPLYNELIKRDVPVLNFNYLTEQT